MKPEIITAIVAAVVAVISAMISLYGQARMTRLADRLAKQRDAESREAQTAALMSKYRDPLLRSAIDLQSRLFNIHQNRMLEYIGQRSPAERDYVIHNTLYVIAEYLGWYEILRREVQFLDLGDLAMNRRLSQLFVHIIKAFGTSRYESTLQLFNGEQRAIGEIMRIPRSGEGVLGSECIGYAAFVQKMADPEFARWFTKLHADLEQMFDQPTLGRKRLVLLHGKLIDLIDFLDPHGVRVEARYRTRLADSE